MKLRRDSGGADIPTFVNFGLRICQLLIGIAVVAMYATQRTYEPWDQFSDDVTFNLGIAAGAIAVATAPFLGVIPFFVGYGPIAFACIWDLIVMAVYAGAFAYYKNRFPYDSEKADATKEILRRFHISNSHIDTMFAGVTVDLVGMLLWLISLLMAIVLILFGRVLGSRAR